MNRIIIILLIPFYCFSQKISNVYYVPKNTANGYTAGTKYLLSAYNINKLTNDIKVTHQPIIDSAFGENVPPYEEDDPVYLASSWYSTTNNASNWNTAYGWGNHASAGYLTSASITGKMNYTDTAYLSNRIDLKQDQLSGTGFVKISGTTISYDNSTYLTPTGSAAGLTSFPTLNQNTTGSAASLTTARNINGVSFNGTADITVTADAGTLSGTTLASGVVNTSITSTGTVNALKLGIQSIATAAGTTTLTVSSPFHTVFTGTSTQNCDLPDATTLTVGYRFKISNTSTGLVTVRTNGGATLWIIASSTDLDLSLTDNSTAAGTWERDYRVGNSASGKASTFNNSITFSGTDGTTMTFPSTTSTIAASTSNLSQFAATTSAQLSTVLSDETGTLGGYVRMASIKLGSDYTNATTTGTEITGLQISSTGTGIVQFEFWVLLQSSATGTGWKFGINHTGTATVLAINMNYPSTGGAAATGVGEDVVANNTGSIYEAAAATSLSTTSPNLGPTAGVAAINTNILVKVFGLLNVTVSGDLELWAGAETANTITVKQNSLGFAKVL